MVHVTYPDHNTPKPVFNCIVDLDRIVLHQTIRMQRIMKYRYLRCKADSVIVANHLVALKNVWHLLLIDPNTRPIVFDQLTYLLKDRSRLNLIRH